MRSLFGGAIFSALLLGAAPAVAQDGRIGVKFSKWQAEKSDVCTAAINVIDADNLRNYVFGLSGHTLAVTGPVPDMASGTLQVDGGAQVPLYCVRSTCSADDRVQRRLVRELRRGWTARLDIRLSSGVRAGPFDIPLAGLEPALKVCNLEPLVPPDFRYLNPEPQVAPVPRGRN